MISPCGKTYLLLICCCFLNFFMKIADLSIWGFEKPDGKENNFRKFGTTRIRWKDLCRTIVLLTVDILTASIAQLS